MRVLLISANTERINLPTLPVGLRMVAAACRAAGHHTVVLDLMTAPSPEHAVAAAVAGHRPEAVGISVRNIDDQEMARPTFLLEPVRDLVARCRRLTRAPIVLGGAGYSIFPDAALAFTDADLGVAGEGEVVFPRLLECLGQGRDPGELPGVHVRGRSGARPRAYERDLDRLPLPGADLLSGVDPDDPAVWVPVQSRRGCPLRCAYCSTPCIEGRRIRRRSARAVAAEVARLQEAGARQIHLVDNTFNLPPSYALELCRELEAHGVDLPWRCILYPHRVAPELAEAMAAAGCVEAALGFESGSAEMLRTLGKGFGPEDVRRTADLLRTVGIRRFGFLMLGGPGETRATVNESLELISSLDLDMMRTTVGIRLYPGTPLAARAREEGVIDADDDLLRPRFYLAPGLDGWIDEIVTGVG
jgi:radical SAM superfamily enzyme YgiQ (UPF0313 family)